MKTIVFAALLSAVPLVAVAQTVPAPITAALADPDRPAAERARDATRHPGELLAFAGIKPGDKVADFDMGGGYWTRILARTVGPSGKVYAYQPAEFIGYRAAYATDQDAAVKGYANVVPKRESLGVLSFAEPLDGIVTVQNWHDLHLKMAPPGSAATIAAHLLTQLKPGGVLLLVYHAARAGAGTADVDTLHRIEPATVRAELEKAGFEFVGELPLLRNASDTHSVNVFDPAVRGRTDQFVFKFRRPK